MSAAKRKHSVQIKKGAHQVNPSGKPIGDPPVGPPAGPPAASGFYCPFGYEPGDCKVAWMRPRALDLFCREGGVSMGLYLAGFDVVGVDIERFARYPFPFFQADAIAFVERFGAAFDFIWASPPCQAYSETQKLQGNEHPDLITPLRPLLEATGRPYVIENVKGAPLVEPVMLCGAMFPGLRTYRHRLFETNWGLHQPNHPEHVAPQTKMGRPPKDGEFIHVVGNFSGADAGRDAMGMPWATRDGLREAIPPEYAEWIGAQFLIREEALRDAA